MASEATVQSLRRLIAEPDDVAPYTENLLSDRIDAADGNVKAVAAQIWTEKAASFAELTDVQEGSSRRALGDLYEQAMAMASQLGAPDPDSRRPGGTRQIVRP